PDSRSYTPHRSSENFLDWKQDGFGVDSHAQRYSGRQKLGQSGGGQSHPSPSQRHRQSQEAPSTLTLMVRCRHSQGVNRGRPVVGPGETRLVASEETGDSTPQHRVGGSGVGTAGFFRRQDSLDPPVALGARRPQGPLPPQDATAQRP